MTHKRILRLQKELQRIGLDAFIVSSLPNIRYLTGFSGSNALCIIGQSRSSFITDSRYAVQSKTEVRGLRRIVTGTGLAEEASKRNLLDGYKKVGFESQSVTYAQYQVLRKCFPGVSWRSTTDLVENILLVKDAEEIAKIREAVKISDSVFNDVVKVIRPGVREVEVAAEIAYLHRKYGAQRDAFETIVASGTRGSLPHARASLKRIKSGELVTLDFGCTYDGYNSDITRTVGVGRLPRKARDMYSAVLEAQSEAIAFARGGIWARDLDAVARRRLKAEGYGKYFIHSLGHGLGLHVHERPRVSALSKERLVAGSVITIEPGVYLPEFGGVRIEDDVLLGDDGCTVLNRAPKDLIIV